MAESAQTEQVRSDSNASGPAAQAELKRSDGDDQARKSAIDWSDPTVPAGNAPPMPRWPLVLSALAFALWLAFLVWMVVLRRTGTS